MTLEQYQKVLLEKRKALEALKTEERKVTLVKDFESMQVVGKKAEDSKQDSKKDKLKKKDDKVHKSMSINVFLKPAEGEVEKCDRRDGCGQGRGGYNRRSSNWQAADPANKDARQDGFQNQLRVRIMLGMLIGVVVDEVQWHISLKLYNNNKG
ncbi:RGG repeats nuclear RNA binding protein A-like [Camellia sinensis]|nr:RGG repeats nuclear RNA binding protein A-like [Camellia sinensis]